MTKRVKPTAVSSIEAQKKAKKSSTKESKKNMRAN